MFHKKNDYTDKKENKIFLIYREIQMGAVARSYMRKGLLIYEEMRKYLAVRRPLVIYDFTAVPLWISLYKRKILFSFLSEYDEVEFYRSIISQFFKDRQQWNILLIYRKLYPLPRGFLSEGWKRLWSYCKIRKGICNPWSTHRVANATFWRTFHHDGKISPAWWGRGMHPPSLYQPSRTKLWCTVHSSWEGWYIPLFLLYPYMYSVLQPPGILWTQFSGQTHSPYFYSPSICILWCNPKGFCELNLEGRYTPPISPLSLYVILCDATPGVLCELSLEGRYTPPISTLPLCALCDANPGVLLTQPIRGRDAWEYSAFNNNE